MGRPPVPSVSYTHGRVPQKRNHEDPHSFVPDPGQFSPFKEIMICYTMPGLIHEGPFRRAPNGPCSGVPCPNTRQGPDPNEPSDFRSRQYKATRLLYLRLTSYAS